VEDAILKTLIYADLFDFPLTKEELWQRLIWERKERPRKKDFEVALKRLEKSRKVLKGVEKGRGREYYFLSGREAIIRLRQRREREAKQKLRRARQIMRLLALCPWIWLVGVSGSVAANNARLSDDIDLFVITAPRRLWLSRLWLVLILELLRCRRRPGDKQFRDKICLNLLLAADHLDYFTQEPDLFLAYELVQLKPLFQRHNSYNQLLSANRWIKKFLPNPLDIPTQKLLKDGRSATIQQKLWDFLEGWAYRFQLWWMNRRRTKEKITPFLAAFHPQNFRQKTLTRFHQSLIEKLNFSS